MNPTVVLAAIDAGITAYERIVALMAEARKEGLITAEEQQERLDRVNRLYGRVGVPLPPSG